MQTYLKNLKEHWRDNWLQKEFRLRFLATLASLFLVVYALSRFLDYIELRTGVILADPLLQAFTPVDVTWLTFLVIYLSVIMAILALILDPPRLMVALQAYILMVILRMVSMYLMPLDPPPLLIPLTDPFVESLSSGTLTRDLFFSGHTATLFLLFLTAQIVALRRFFLVSTILVGIFVLIQHVHYTIDVLAAPFYSYAAYRLSIFADRKV